MTSTRIIVVSWTQVTSAINNTIFYDFLSYYVERFFGGNQKPSGAEFIKHERDSAREEGISSNSDIYKGVEFLYENLQSMSKAYSTTPKKL